MKNLAYIWIYFVVFFLLSINKSKGQTIFQEKVFFKIKNIKLVDNKYKYLIEFESQQSGPASISGIGTLTMSIFSCDSIWDVWPEAPTGNLLGIGTLYYSSSSGGNPPPLTPIKGMMGVIQMPGSFIRETEFMLHLVFKFDD